MIYTHYELALSKEEPDRHLYLAAPEDTYNQFFTLQFIQDALSYNQVSYLVYKPDDKVIVRWKK